MRAPRSAQEPLRSAASGGRLARCPPSTADAMPRRRLLTLLPRGFHSDFRLGTVERLARREPSLRVAVVALVPVRDPAAADPAEHAGRAGWIVFTRRPPAP